MITMEERAVVSVLENAIDRLSEDLYHANVQCSDDCQSLSGEEVAKLRENGLHPDFLIRVPLVEAFALRAIAVDTTNSIGTELRAAILDALPDNKSIDPKEMTRIHTEKFNRIASLAPQIFPTCVSYEAPTVSIEAPDQSPSP